MIVTKENIDAIIKDIDSAYIKGFDTETRGKKHEDRLFALIISVPNNTYYFNFLSDPDHLGGRAPCYLSGPDTFRKLDGSFRTGIWSAHNALFDIQKLELEGIRRPRNIHCTLATERIIRNDLLDYSLEAVAPRYGLEKDKTVDEYIMKHKLYTKVMIPGKKKVVHNKHFDKVPFEIIQPYAEKDALIHRLIAESQMRELSL